MANTKKVVASYANYDVEGWNRDQLKHKEEARWFFELGLPTSKECIESNKILWTKSKKFFHVTIHVQKNFELRKLWVLFWSCETMNMAHDVFKKPKSNLLEFIKKNFHI